MALRRRPTRYPILLGDLVLTGNGDKADAGDLPERLVRDVFGQIEFVVRAKLLGCSVWRDTYAWYTNLH